jgi:hypothetical protein
MEEIKYEGPIQPHHLREAHRRLKKKQNYNKKKLILL